MSFSDHKITQFTHRISELADQPSLPADELKARFDSSPEELRVAHNAVCDDADRLEARVEGIVAETFGDAIDMVEYKYIYKENVARCVKMGVPNLPSMYINGELKYRSIIPTKAELEASIREAIEACKG